ncbi:hypothetical protein MCAP1_001026 [Malassezia caprae]|uniref:Nascent polypeptide-associated complex subunit alpha-like UBA domain-containing protein n=1 Tax=Malassezia caprae TaxID=1381934 RepID=A0AAF0E4R1_9BASI|nr:hypothetical protein MCAP1_001026 [Malassezia caprae]
MAATKNAKSEVLQEWADFDANGAKFERGLMEKHVQSICFLDPAGVPSALKQDKHKGVKVKGADIAFLTNELLVDAHVAEAAIVESGGDMDKALGLLLRQASV